LVAIAKNRLPIYSLSIHVNFNVSPALWVAGIQRLFRCKLARSPKFGYNETILFLLFLLSFVFLPFASDHLPVIILASITL
jgi:hypothetical protein